MKLLLKLLNNFLLKTNDFLIVNLLYFSLLNLRKEYLNQIFEALLTRISLYKHCFSFLENLFNLSKILFISIFHHQFSIEN